MKKLFVTLNRRKCTGLLSTLCYLAAGILLLLRPALLQDVSRIVLIVMLLFLAVYWMIRYFRAAPEEAAKGFDLAEALVVLFLGFALLFFPDLFAQLLPRFWGALLLLGGFMILQEGIDFLRLKYERWWIFLILAGISMLLGILAETVPAFLEANIALFISLSLLYQAGVSLFTLIVSWRLEKARETAEDSVSRS